eukprot:5463635-Alexandrium_andersonii.AAC.1
MVPPASALGSGCSCKDVGCAIATVQMNCRRGARAAMGGGGSVTIPSVEGVVQARAPSDVHTLSAADAGDEGT